MRYLLWISLFCLFGLPLQGQDLGYTPPVPMKLDPQGNSQPNANNILFFQHPAVPESASNFKEAPSKIILNGNELNVSDIAGAPGFLSAAVLDPPGVEGLLADPQGLCFEDILMNLVCERGDFTDINFNQKSYGLLAADLRKTDPGERNVEGVLLPEVILDGLPTRAPYGPFSFDSVIARPDPPDLPESPPAICYDITKGDDWMACPVFGKIFVRGKTVLSDNDDYALKHNIELQSPVILYRQGPDQLYHLAGYLANPSLPNYVEWDRGNPKPKFRFGNSYFPQAITSGNFFDPLGAEKMSDIAVMGTATLPHLLCSWFLDEMGKAGLRPEDFPHQLDCTNGSVWVRHKKNWGRPREIFDSSYLLMGPPKVYDLAAAIENGRDVLFAPSGVPDANGKFWVYKYFDESRRPVLTEMSPTLGEFVFPIPIEVTPPAPNLVPFKIAAKDINKDGRADFALTWRDAERFSDPFNRLWQAKYSPYVSVFISGEAFHFQVPKIDSPEIDTEAELAAVTFSEKENQEFLVVGNQKRIMLESGEEHAFAYFFPITGGIIEDQKVKPVQVSFKSYTVQAPGVADLAADSSSGTLASLMREPFVRAPEGCNVQDGEVYGVHWFGDFAFDGVHSSPMLDHNFNGVPNRCECRRKVANGLEFVLPDKENDPDMDEIARECDSCPAQFNVGDHDGDGRDEVCDNCVGLDNPDQKDGDQDGKGDACDNCSALANVDQADADQDRLGDACDICPNKFNPLQSQVYFLSYVGADGRMTPKDYCNRCINGYRAPQDGLVQDAFPLGREWANNCNLRITSPDPQDQHDADLDGVPNGLDNCAYVFNPSPGVDQDQIDDSDGDGSGDPCDCPNAGPNDDCDGDNIPNRFDRTPRPVGQMRIPHIDIVVASNSSAIASWQDLRPAQVMRGNIGASSGRQLQGQRAAPFSGAGVLPPPDLSAAQNGGLGGNRGMMIGAMQAPPQVGGQGVANCGFRNKVFPGPNPCDQFGNAPREITAILPKKATPPGEPPPPPGEPPPPEVPPGDGSHVVEKVGLTQLCIAKVGRRDPRTAALFESGRKKVIEANDRVQQITGLKDFDIFVGGEGGLIHWECVFIGGSAPKLNVAKGMLPNVAGNFAPYGIWQVAGLPIYTKYEVRPTVAPIQAPAALRLAPVNVAAADQAKGVAKGDEVRLPPDGAARLPTPNVSSVVVGAQESVIPSDGVQSGQMRYNINGNMVIKVLNSISDFQAEGTDLAVGDYQSLIALDMKSYPAPPSSVPIEDRPYKIDVVLKALEEKVAQWKSQGKTITPEIFLDLPWGEAMRPQFLVMQDTLPEAMAVVKNMAVELALGRAQVIGGVLEVGADLEAVQTQHVILPAYIVPPSLSIAGTGGCGCRVDPSGTVTFAGLIFFLLMMTPVPVLLYYRKRLKK